jgi:(4S)-4-hydroxy-5-phosphonooxypentane-2,3-dione isomerase
MYIVHVFVHVKAEYIDDFITATVENARKSLLEPGVARFDVIQQLEDPSKFILVEVYKNAHDPVRHKETAHYAKWRDTVADMMIVPRTGIRYINLFPDEKGWI